MAINLEFIDAPLWYHKRGLMQTATGYGSKIKTPFKALTNNRAYRVYCSIYSNVGLTYIIIKGEKITVERYE